jgi:hypothetical protein
MTVKTPKHPVSQLATFELSRHREQLESALATIPEQSAEHQVYAGRLAQVITEQTERAGHPEPMGTLASQLSCWDIVRAQLTMARTWSEASPARHSTDHG